MRLCHGIAGHVIDVDEAELQWKKPIDLVEQYAHERWDMPTADLIALSSSGSTVGPAPASEALGTNKDVFVFARSALDPRSEVSVEPLVLSESTDAGKDSQAAATANLEDELLRLRAKFADPAFEAFRSNIEEAHRWLLESRPVNALAFQAVARLEVQRQAAQAVLENLTSHRASCSRSMSLFLQKYSKVQERFDQNLDNVEPCMDALATVSLHPSLQAPGRAVLADLVPRERISKFTSNLQVERKRLAHRLDKLRQQDAQVQTYCEQVKEHMLEFSQEDGAEIVGAKIRSEHARAEIELLPELRSIVPREGADPSSVLEEEKRSAQVLEGLARLCESIREHQLPELQARWEQRHAQFLQRLREVSYVQSKVRDVERQAALLEEEINEQRNYSQQLAHLKKMPKAYQKMLFEVPRRKQFAERYLAEREQARVRLARMVEEENSRRREFLQRHGCHLPAELAHGLGAQVPQVRIDLTAFDAELPDIDFKFIFDSSVTGASPSAPSDSSGYRAAPASATGQSLQGRAESGLSRDRTESTSSSSSLQPWTAKGVSSTSSGGRSAQATPHQSLDRCITGDGPASSQVGSQGGGSQGGSSVQGGLGSSGQAASHLANSQDGGTGTGGSSQSLGGTGTAAGTSSSSRLEAQNRELTAQVASLMEELARLRETHGDVDASQVMSNKE